MILKMSSNSRITRSKGSSDGTSLPPYTRPRKDMSTKADNAESLPSSTQQQTACDQLNSTVSHSPFVRPGSRAGASTAPATPTGMPLASASPFAWPGSHAGSLVQPHKLQDHRTVICQYHLLMKLCSHEMQTHRLAGT